MWGNGGRSHAGYPGGRTHRAILVENGAETGGEHMRSCVELLAGIPSVIYGLVGMILIVPALQHLFNLSSGSCLLAAILVLSVMVLPYIISVSLTALNAVPPQYEHASLALGASPVETYVKVSLRAASSGVFASIIQGTGRALGSAQLAEQVLYNLIDNAIQR